MSEMEMKIDRLKRENAVVQAMNDAMAAEGAVLKAVYSRQAKRQSGAAGETVIAVGPKPKPLKEGAVVG